MDAATREELDALRRRAFGPGGDIQDDPAAIARLIELERLARPAAPDAPLGGTSPEAASTPAPPPESRAESPAIRRARVRRGTITGAILAVAAVIAGIVLVQPPSDPLTRSAGASPDDGSGPRLIAEARSTVLMTIRREMSFGGYIRLPTDREMPAFPTAAPLEWSAFLGQYYGWELWIAGGSGDPTDEHCILIRRDDETRGECSDAEGERSGRLRVMIAGSDIPAVELPEPMAARDRIRFRWLESGGIEIALGMFGVD